MSERACACACARVSSKKLNAPGAGRAPREENSPPPPAMADQYWANPSNVAHHLRGALGYANGAYPDGVGAPLTLAQIEVLNLSGTNWTDADCAQLASRLRAPKLKRLVLKDNPITGVGLCAIGLFVAQHPDVKVAMPDHLQPPRVGQ